MHGCDKNTSLQFISENDRISVNYEIISLTDAWENSPVDCLQECSVRRT